jgi:hypothetical protein
MYLRLHKKNLYTGWEVQIGSAAYPAFLLIVTMGSSSMGQAVGA